MRFYLPENLCIVSECRMGSAAGFKRPNAPLRPDEMSRQQRKITKMCPHIRNVIAFLKEAYKKTSQADRDALIRFLESL